MPRLAQPQLITQGVRRASGRGCAFSVVLLLVEASPCIWRSKSEHAKSGSYTRDSESSLETAFSSSVNVGTTGTWFGLFALASLTRRAARVFRWIESRTFSSPRLALAASASALGSCSGICSASSMSFSARLMRSSIVGALRISALSCSRVRLSVVLARTWLDSDGPSSTTSSSSVWSSSTDMGERGAWAEWRRAALLTLSGYSPQEWVRAAAAATCGVGAPFACMAFFGYRVCV